MLMKSSYKPIDPAPVQRVISRHELAAILEGHAERVRAAGLRSEAHGLSLFAEQIRGSRVVIR